MDQVHRSSPSKLVRVVCATAMWKEKWYARSFQTNKKMVYQNVRVWNPRSPPPRRLESLGGLAVLFSNLGRNSQNPEKAATFRSPPGG